MYCGRGIGRQQYTLKIYTKYNSETNNLTCCAATCLFCHNRYYCRHNFAIALPPSGNRLTLCLFNWIEWIEQNLRCGKTTIRNAIHNEIFSDTYVRTSGGGSSLTIYNHRAQKLNWILSVPTDRTNERLRLLFRRMRQFTYNCITSRRGRAFDCARREYHVDKTVLIHNNTISANERKYNSSPQFTVSILSAGIR